jgi:hypothetical protein
MLELFILSPTLIRIFLLSSLLNVQQLRGMAKHDFEYQSLGLTVTSSEDTESLLGESEHERKLPSRLYCSKAAFIINAMMLTVSVAFASSAYMHPVVNDESCTRHMNTWCKFATTRYDHY